MRLFPIILLLFIAPCSTAQVDSTTFRLEAFRKHMYDSVPGPDGRITDYEGILTDSMEQVLEKRCYEVNEQGLGQIAIVTVDTTFVAYNKFDGFIRHVGNSWGVGDSIKNNGLIIGLSKNYRRVRINTGYGLQDVLTDDEAKRILDEHMIPFFRRNEYFEGLIAGIEAIIKELK